MEEGPICIDSIGVSVFSMNTLRPTDEFVYFDDDIGFFVPYSKDGITKYYSEVDNAGLLQRFTFAYCEDNRSTLQKMSDYKQFLRTTPIDDALIKEFADFAAKNGIAPHWYYIKQSQDIILTRLKAMIARDIFGPMAYNVILNRDDNTVQEALNALNKHKAAFPITE